MGRLTHPAPVPAKKARQSMEVPCTCSRDNAVTSAVSSPWSRRSTGTTNGPSTSCPVAADSCPPGPSSTYAPTPASRRARMPSAKRTVSRTCRTQYSGEHSSPAVATVPVRFDTTASRGSPNSRPPTTRRNSSSTGSINGEWNACETRKRLVLRPSPSKRAPIARTAPSSPDTTTDPGPFTAATDTPSVSKGATSSSAASTATIAPPDGNPSINRARAATRRHASSSENTPATCAAATSPIECPAT